MNSKRLMFVVLVVLFVFGLALSIAEAWDARDWRVALFSLGPELMGAVVTYVLFDQFIDESGITCLDPFIYGGTTRAG